LPERATALKLNWNTEITWLSPENSPLYSATFKVKSYNLINFKGKFKLTG
jgi:hypothetical protein